MELQLPTYHRRSTNHRILRERQLLKHVAIFVGLLTRTHSTFHSTLDSDMVDQVRRCNQDGYSSLFDVSLGNGCWPIQAAQLL